METRILVLGKGDNVITMILDNLYSYSIDRLLDFGKDIVIYNNLDFGSCSILWLLYMFFLLQKTAQEFIE